jgi:hypothetical protein
MTQSEKPSAEASRKLFLGLRFRCLRQQLGLI